MPAHHIALVTAGIALAVLAPAQSPGLRLFSPTGPNPPQLVDELGNIVHSWPGINSPTIHLLDDGTLLRGVVAPGTGIPGSTGRLDRVDFDGNVLWDLLVNDATRAMHHDIEPMPNGNVLVIVWDRLTVADAVAAGRDPALITGTDWLPDSILEIQPTGPTSGTVVWEWHLMDHVIQDFDPTKANYGVVGDHPELLDVNFPPAVLNDGDWNHANGLDYDPLNDWIVLSSRSQAELYLIDHSTTTAEAAGHTGGQRGRGGDLLWRWGNPQAYRAGSFLDQQLNGQHDPRFVRPGHPGAGHITLFNNSYYPNQSAVFELELPLDAAGNIVLDPVTGRYGPLLPTWMFTEPTFFSQFVSSAQRLANGNTLVCSGFQQRLFEVTAAGQTVWSYTHPTTNFLFQAHHVERSLWHDTDELSVAGGKVLFRHLLGSPHTGDGYMLLGSISGTSPGTVLPGGVSLPLNADALTVAMSTTLGGGPFVDTVGMLGADGDGRSVLAVPPGFMPPGLVGLHLDFAHLIFDDEMVPLRSGNPVGVTIVP